MAKKADSWNDEKAFSSPDLIASSCFTSTPTFHSTVVYFENKLCNKVIISTKFLFIANYIINDYNKNYERIGNAEWVMISNEYGYAKIYFEFTKNYYNFIWK